MVGWVPWDLSLRRERAARLLDRVKQSQECRPDEIPLLLQYDYRCGDLRGWVWPEVNGIPVRPDELDRHRYEYYFKGPCCLCSYIQNTDILTEAKMGLAQTIVQPATAKCLGRYVAICATQECGYFVNLERFFGHPNLMTGEYTKRKTPVKVMDPFLFMTDDTEETIKKTGLRQIQVLQDGSNTGLRGTNRLLRREDPTNFRELQDLLQRLLGDGLPAEGFWDLFVQCTDCKYVMPRHYFPYYHPCVVRIVRPAVGTMRRLPAPEIPEPSLPEDVDMDSVPPALSSDDSMIGLPILQACAVLTRREGNLTAEPTTPKGRPIPT